MINRKHKIVKINPYVSVKAINVLNRLIFPVKRLRLDKNYNTAVCHLQDIHLKNRGKVGGKVKRYNRKLVKKKETLRIYQNINSRQNKLQYKKP